MPTDALRGRLLAFLATVGASTPDDHPWVQEARALADALNKVKPATPRPGEREIMCERLSWIARGDNNLDDIEREVVRWAREEIATLTRELAEALDQLMEIAESLHLSLEDHGEDDRIYWLHAEPGPIACTTVAEAVREMVRLRDNDDRRASQELAEKSTEVDELGADLNRCRDIANEDAKHLLEARAEVGRKEAEAKRLRALLDLAYDALYDTDRDERHAGLRGQTRAALNAPRAALAPAQEVENAH